MSCKECNEETHLKFCSKACSAKDYRDRKRAEKLLNEPDRHCKVCDSLLDKGSDVRKVFCSPKCRKVDLANNKKSNPENYSKCSFSGCGEVAYGKGYCRDHYRLIIEGGNSEQSILDRPNQTCLCCGDVIERTSGKLYDRKFCNILCHSKYHREQGSNSRESRLAKGRICTIEGCGEPSHSKDLCNNHNIRKLRHGDPTHQYLYETDRECQGCGTPLGREKGDLCKPCYFKNYLNDNREVINARVNARRERVKEATPRWADWEAIDMIYLESAKRTRGQGIEYHVDHVIPLQGKLVSGLHVENNLKVISAEINRSKSNKY